MQLLTYTDNISSKPYVYNKKGAVIRFTPIEDYNFYELYTEPVTKKTLDGNNSTTVVGYCIKLYKSQCKKYLVPIVKRRTAKRIEIKLHEDFNESFDMLRKQGELVLVMADHTSVSATYVVIGKRIVSPDTHKKRYILNLPK